MRRSAVTRLGISLGSFTSPAHLGSVNLPAASASPGLWKLVGIRTYFADFHSFHKPHQIPEGPVPIFFSPLFLCCLLIAAGPVGTVNKPSVFFARLIQAIVGKSSAAFCFFPHWRQFQQAFPRIFLRFLQPNSLHFWAKNLNKEAV